MIQEEKRSKNSSLINDIVPLGFTLVFIVLLGACQKHVASTPIPKDLVQSIIEQERGIFKNVDPASDGMGFSKSGSFTSHSGSRFYVREEIADFDNSEPQRSIIGIMNNLIAFAQTKGLGVREDSWWIQSFGESESVEPYESGAYYRFKGPGVSSNSGSRRGKVRNRFIHAQIAFGHPGNISFLYSWDMVYDVEEQVCTLLSSISYSEPVSAQNHAPILGDLKIHQGEL
jgi:hypothetical protein